MLEREYLSEKQAQQNNYISTSLQPIFRRLRTTAAAAVLQHASKRTAKKRTLTNTLLLYGARRVPYEKLCSLFTSYNVWYIQ